MFLLLGNTALQSVLDLKGINQYRGSVLEDEDDNILYFPVYHPSYILRFPEYEDIWLKDLNNFKRYIDGQSIKKQEFKVNIKIVDNLPKRKEALSDIKNQKVVSLDIETSGLNPFDTGSWVTSLGIGTADTQYCFMLNHRLSRYYNKYASQKRIVEQIHKALEGRLVVAQNGKFDTVFLKSIFGLTFDINFDTKLASYMLNEEAKNSLDDLSVRYFNAPNYNVPLEIKFGVEGSIEEHCEYLARDLLYTYKLYNIFDFDLNQDEATQMVFEYITMPLSNMYRDAEYQGLFIQPDKLNKASDYWHEQLNKALKELQKYGNINWRSTAQVKDILFTVLQLPVLDRTKTGNPSTSESVLKRIDHPVAGHLIKFRKANQNISFFIDGWNKRKDNNNYIHPTFKIDGTVTGRPSCKDPNLQQTPRDPRIRSIIEAPTGWELIEIDISQAELRIAAEMSKCPGLIRAFREGVDVHTRIVQNTFGIMEPTSEQRKKGKAINFGYLYGMGWPKFIIYARDNYDTVVNPTEAKQSRNTYFRTWPGLEPWHEKQRLFVKSFGYVRSLIGRKRRLPKINSSNRFESLEAERQAINSPVQSLASDWNLAAAIQMKDEFDEDKAKIIGTVHDSTLLIARSSYVEEISKRAIAIMENPDIITKTFKLKMTVPMIAEVKIGPWGKSHTGIN